MMVLYNGTYITYLPVSNTQSFLLKLVTAVRRKQNLQCLIHINQRLRATVASKILKTSGTDDLINMTQDGEGGKRKPKVHGFIDSCGC